MAEKYTLGKNYILRQPNKESFELFNTVKSKIYEISAELYLILKLFKYNSVEKKEVYDYFLENAIKVNIEKFESFIAQEEFSDLLVYSEIPYTSIMEYSLFEFPSFVKNTPKRVELIITEKCNLECKHCFQGSSPLKEANFPSLEKLKLLCDELDRLDVTNLKISGGEPLIYPQIDLFLEYLSKKRFQKSILTNALLLNDKLIDIVRGNNFRFGISLDGATKENHEFLRGKNTFDRTINNILKLRKNNIYFSITSTIYKNNIDEVSEICDLVFKKLNARVLNLNVLMPLGRGQSNYDLSASLNDIQSLKETINHLRKLYPDKVIDIDNSYEVLDYEVNNDIIYCAAGTEFFAINSFLDVYPCTYGFGKNQFKMGEFNNENLIDIWRNSNWNIFRGETKLKDLKVCPSCKFKNHCLNKSCRLKPVYQGKDFYSPIEHCSLFGQ